MIRSKRRSGVAPQASQPPMQRRWTPRRLRPLSRRSIVHIEYEDGRFQAKGIGAWYSYWRDPYHLMLTIPWWGFAGLMTLAYGGINLLFALLYYLGPPGSITNTQPGSFGDMFFFSVQTLASIGYGAMYPANLYANIIVTIEAIVGLIGLAMMTGLAFARFALTKTRVRFSRHAVITFYNGIPTLMFRTANERRNYILEAQLQVFLMRDEISPEGHSLRRFYELPLVRNKTPSFSLSWTVMHQITQSSPLHGETIESLQQTHAAIIISLSGIDETLSQVVHARHLYVSQDLRWDHQFVDIFHHTSSGHRYIDYADFDQVTPSP